MIKDVNTVPIVSYYNAYKDKYKILKENKSKSGIYRWVNNNTSENSVGSSKNLTNRFVVYYSIKSMKSQLKKGSSNIYTALIELGHSNFSLYILEYCEPSVLIAREQYYIDLLKSQYNIKRAESRGVSVKVTNSSINFIEIFPTITSVAKYFNIRVITVREYLNKDINYNGFIFESYNGTNL